MGNLMEWIKRNKRNILLTLLIILALALSFGLGYLANRESNHAPIIIEKYSQATSSFSS